MKKRPAAAAAAAAASPDEDEDPDRRLTPKEIDALIKKSNPWKTSMVRKAPNNAALKLLSWNVNGIRAVLQRDPNILKKLGDMADVIFLEETKLQDDNDKSDFVLPDNYESLWLCSKQKKGYAGVAVLWKATLKAKVTSGVGLPEADNEGRCLTLELPNLYIVCAYVPNAGQGLTRLNFRIKKWEPAMSKYLKKLDAKKPVVYCGDLNVCHKELDLWGNHNGNLKTPGYTPEERQAMTKFLEGNGLVDTFRHLHPNTRAFSFWPARFGARAKNHGWRLDYCLASKRLLPKVYDSFVLPQIKGSDHCPVGLVLQ